MGDFEYMDAVFNQHFQQNGSMTLKDWERFKRQNQGIRPYFKESKIRNDQAREMAKRLLNSGVKRGDIHRQLRAEFNISKVSAYARINEALNQFTQSTG